ncbi:MAG TPA: hypothetical protein VGX92_13685 [Pyrinomonadaceae bacterium]|jgi:hypothetical protein|nr:hypothetical protein [Pyrinomonadaceae bacterium]
MRRLLLIVAALNAAGLACFYATQHPHDPSAGGQHLALVDSSYMLDSVGFTLMLPGIFFAAIAFLCARALTWSDEAARAAWYATGFALNMIIAWRIGDTLTAPRT